MHLFFRDAGRLKPAGPLLWSSQRGEIRSTRSPRPLSVVTSRSPLRAEVTGMAANEKVITAGKQNLRPGGKIRLAGKPSSAPKAKKDQS